MTINRRKHLSITEIEYMLLVGEEHDLDCKPWLLTIPSDKFIAL